MIFPPMIHFEFICEHKDKFSLLAFNNLKEIQIIPSLFNMVESLCLLCSDLQAQKLQYSSHRDYKSKDIISFTKYVTRH